MPALEGVDAHVILGEEGPLVSRLLQRGISTEVIPLNKWLRDVRRRKVISAWLPIYAAMTLAYSMRLARRLRQMKPDLIHANSLKAAVYGAVAAKLTGIPIVWQVRDRVSNDYLSLSAARGIRWLASHSPAAVIANSQTTLSALELTSRVPSAVVFGPIEQNGSKAGNMRADSTFTVGMVGRMAPWKGQDIFVRAFAHAFPYGTERALVVGAALFGEDRYAEEVKALAAGLGLNGRLEFAGFHEDVGSQLCRCDVLVHASVIPEPFGQVVVEGMAAGLPVVAAGAGGPAEIISDGENGLLYPPGDWMALSSALRRLAGDPALRKRLASEGERRSKAFSPKAAAQQVKAVYDGIMGPSTK